MGSGHQGNRLEANVFQELGQNPLLKSLDIFNERERERERESEAVYLAQVIKLECAEFQKILTELLFQTTQTWLSKYKIQASIYLIQNHCFCNMNRLITNTIYLTFEGKEYGFKSISVVFFVCLLIVYPEQCALKS